ncbi:MAG: UDP-glucose/GDP-mannose dehydrogenase family protein, partial [Verrucomicrobiae bacterium]|nr:UDP-glucose/GDP-mannose dehydrogenase family protein [Verrucomicrobiae bacterium]
TFCANPYEAARGADAVVLATEWDEFQHLDYGKIKALMTNPIFFDGRNLLDPAQMAALGFTYKSIGR